MTVTLSKPSDVSAPVRDAGGDNEVPRDQLGRPRIWVNCDGCDGSGRIPSEKREGNTVKCKKSCTDGRILRSFTRVTTYIDVLDDKSNLMAWAERMVLIGIAEDPSLLDDVLAEDRESRSGKDALNRKAAIAKSKAGAEKKADKGTELHGLSELVDQGINLPPGISFGDVIDMDAYRESTRGFKIVHMEKLVVNDEIGCAGTPDRVSEWAGSVPLVAPDGHEFLPGELIITDLKTGTVEYGALKMAMQLAIYARSNLYDKDSGERSPIENINLDWGIIMNVPAGSGEATLYWADLRLGWRAVLVAGQVRELRSKGSKALSRFLSAA